ncbi:MULTISPECIES: sugar isomerase [unclassified Clostridium]|jgi:fructoselysine-6-P-deglycase FrlB-like protein|uniref:sugar isomerase n=1 Tax=unclassified Clostridium TaxID=2614128 RepID=UPI001106A696|nr:MULTISPECIES: sugar isomerase [unclassified Clostridium]
MDIREIIEKIAREKESAGGIKSVVWLAAGGSNGGNYPAQYFMDREAKTIRSQMFTSNEFVYAPPKFVNENTIAVITSMRGTPETCVAAQIARDMGATTIGLYVQESLLTETCEYNVKYDSIMFDESDQSRTNSSLGLRIAMDIVDVTEGYDNYDDAMSAFTILDCVYNDAKAYCLPLAEQWAEKNKDEKIISVLSSGPAFAAGYTFSICNIMEMLQIQSPTVNSCEFFHGPFEVVDKKGSFFLLVAEGRTRRADERAVKFLKEYGGDKVYILDAKELGINRFKDTVCEYFNHMLFAPILNNVYMKALSKATKVDYMTRRYMWKVEY